MDQIKEGNQILIIYLEEKGRKESKETQIRNLNLVDCQSEDNKYRSSDCRISRDSLTSPRFLQLNGYFW